MATTRACRPKCSAIWLTDFGRFNRRRIHCHLIGPGGKQSLRILQCPHAPTHGQRYEEPARHPVYGIHQRGASLAGSRYVQHDQLVRALTVIRLGQFTRVSGIP